MRALRSTGIYTQDPALVPAADLFCGVSGGTLYDPYTPAVKEVVYYLVTGLGTGGESPLGEDSAGNPRPNDNPCP